MILILLFGFYKLFAANFYTGLFSLIAFIFLYTFISKMIRNYKLNNQKYLTKEKIIMITGGCMGIGKEMINILINKYNCTVINVDIRDDLFEDLKNSLGNKSTNVFNYKCDISNQTDMTNTFTEISKKFPKINILINNAAIAKNEFFQNLTENQITKTIEINLISPFILTKKFLDLMEKHPKNEDEFHVVNIGSNLSHITTRKSAPYITSKWGIYGMHDSIKYGIFIIKNRLL